MSAGIVFPTECVDILAGRTILRGVDIDLTPDQQVLIRHAIEAGRAHTAEQAVHEALALWEERERRRAEFMASLDEARASIANGAGLPITRESMEKLAEDVKRGGRERLAMERSAPV